METLNDIDNDEKVMISALLGDTLQPANGIRSQIEQIHEALGNTRRFNNIVQCEQDRWLSILLLSLQILLAS